MALNTSRKAKRYDRTLERAEFTSQDETGPKRVMVVLILLVTSSPRLYLKCAFQKVAKIGNSLMVGYAPRKALPFRICDIGFLVDKWAFTQLSRFSPQGRYNDRF